MVIARSGNRGGDNVELGGTLSLRSELTRKGLHLLSTAVPVAYAAGLSRSAVIGGLGIALVIALVVEIARMRNTRARAVFQSSVGPLLRTHERDASSGATWLLVALLVAAVAFPKDIAVSAMCAVALGDAAAAIVGRTLPGASAGTKSFGGSAACFVATAVASGAIASLPWYEALLAGLLAAFAERPKRPLDDNLRIAVAVGCGILLWRMGFS